MKTTDKTECITQVYGVDTGNPVNQTDVEDYTLSNLGVFVTWIPVAE
jgi:hypothetical protein